MVSIDFTVQGDIVLDVAVDTSPSINVEIQSNEMYFEVVKAGPKGDPGPGIAVDVTYDNSSSNLAASNVQTALDEIDEEFVRKQELAVDGGVLVNGGNW